jgi:uncharacterized membrane protein YfcA
MSIRTILGLIFLGLCAGALSSLVGIGGGIVIVPALVGFFGLSQHTAQGTTLAMLSFPVSLVAALTYYKNGMVDWKIALVLCVGFMIGSFFVSKFAVTIPTLTIKKIFAVLMIVVAIKFLFIDKK